MAHKPHHRKVGRPSEKTNARELLIYHARELFMVMPYEKVSTRLIADKAGVNVAMIRYYFGSKDGLFEHMVSETIRPIREQLKVFAGQGGQESLLALMGSYYKTMIETPLFPKLIAQIMNMPESAPQRQTLEKVIREVVSTAQDFLFAKLLKEGVLKEDMDPKLCRLTFISMMIFPFIAPKAMLAFHGVELNETFLNQLLEHNIKVLSQGFLSSEPTSFGENNDIES